MMRKMPGIHGVSVVEVPLEPQLFYQKYSWLRHPIKKYRQRQYLKKVLVTFDLKEGK